MIHPSVTIYSRADCHICGVVYRIALRLQKELSFRLQYVDVDADYSLTVKYGHRVPVIAVDGQELPAGTVTASQLRDAVKKARWRSPISRILSRVRLILSRGRSFL